MKQLLTTLALLFSATCYSQDTIRTEIGYEIDYNYLHVKIDTIHNHATIAHYYHRRAYVSINGGKAQLMKRGRYLTVWSNHFTVTITRKRFKQTYEL